MGLFKKKVICEIEDGIWGHLVNAHRVDVDTLAKDMRCVQREGVVDGKPVTLVRVFKLSDVRQKGVEIKGWETLDEHPDLIRFEGYLTKTNEARLERKGA